MVPFFVFVGVRILAAYLMRRCQCLDDRQLVGERVLVGSYAVALPIRLRYFRLPTTFGIASAHVFGVSC